MTIWKHHIAKHFEEDQTLANDPENGPGYGATVFTNYEKMIDYLKRDGRQWFVCECEVNLCFLRFNFGNDWMATILCDMGSKEGFKPLNLQS